jgi:phosphohistidine phosphatase
MIFYLVRHGIAVDRTDPKSPSEPERPLTAKGVQKSRQAALGLAELGVKPDLILTSPFVRAAQTAEIFAEALGIAQEKIRPCEALKPSGSPAEVLKMAARLKAKEAMCFGHAPHLDQMVAQLACARGTFTSLKKAGVACLQQGTGGRWEVLWILTPKILRQLA